MSPKVDRIGRAAAVISSLILSALFLNLWVLSADAEEQREKIPTSQYSSKQFTPDEPTWIERAIDYVSMARQSGNTVPAHAIGSELGPLNRGGKPFAYVFTDELYIIDKRGRIIASADSCSHYNLPIISGSSFYIDEQQKMLVDAGAQNAIELLSEIQKYSELEPLLSEIKVHNNEVIAYLSFSNVIPVIFGEGEWQQKIDNLIAYQRQLGGSELAKIAAYLDLRIENRIVVKKNV